MRATLRRHKAFTAGLAAFALGLAWVIPAATAGAVDAGLAGADGIEVDVIPVQVEGQVVFKYVDGFDGGGDTYTEAYIATGDGQLILFDEDVTEEDGLSRGMTVEGTLLVPAEVADSLPLVEQAALADLVGEAPADKAATGGLVALAVDAAPVQALLEEAAVSQALVPLEANYNVAKPPFPQPTADDYNVDWDVAVITPDGTSDITDRQIRDYIEAAEEFYRTETGKPFNFVVNDIKRGSTTVTDLGAETLAVGDAAAALYGHTGNGAWDGVYHYLGSAGDRLLLFAPQDEYLTGQSAIAYGFDDQGIDSGGFVVIPLSARIFDTMDQGDELTEVWQKALAHEIGHVFGAGHATTRLCPNAPSAATWNEADLGACTYPAVNSGDDYSDRYSFMGGGTIVNPTFRYVFGLLDDSQQVVIDEPVTNQLVTLRSPTGSQGAEVLVVADAEAGIDYTFEFRQEHKSYENTPGGAGVYAFRLTNDYFTYWHETGPSRGRMTEGATFVSQDGLVRVTLLHQYSGYAQLSVTRGGVAMPKAAISSVSVTGTAVVGWTLTAVVGPTTPSNATKTFQWYRGASAIWGATDSQYTLDEFDTGQRVKVRVTASAPGYTSSVLNSALVTVAAAPTPTLSVSSNSVSLPAEASTFGPITVTTNQPSWSVSSNKSWLTVTKAANSFTLSAADNTTASRRTATVTVLAGGVNRVVAVTQDGAAPILSVSSATVSVGAAGGTSSAITVTTNQSSWSVTDNASWLTTSKAANTFTVTATANTSTASRTATVTVTAGSATAVTVTVTQAGAAAPTLSVSPMSVSLGAAAETSSAITVTTNQSSWTATDNATWLTVNTSASSFTVTAAENTSTVARTATVTVKAGSATAVTVAVTQAAGTPVTISSVTVSGTPAPGQVLTATVGATTPSTSTKTYSWYRGSSTISGATGYQYTLVAADAGKQVKCVVVATAPGYTPGRAESAPVTVAAASLSVSSTSLALIAPPSTTTVSVTTNQPSWTVTDNAAWLTVAQSGSSFTVSAAANTTSAVRNATITVSAGVASKVWITVTQAAPSPVVITSVTVVGAPSVGSTLSAAVVTDPADATMAYKWYRGATVISGATSSQYTPVAADVGKAIKVRVTASATGY
ncbi:MAG: hypothetical protein LBR27_08245, partial [Bifidobacteriaceae bacterium]|nr:hypothetical protein [Bifidobacteriaceae bacterium]